MGCSGWRCGTKRLGRVRATRTVYQAKQAATRAPRRTPRRKDATAPWDRKARRAVLETSPEHYPWEADRLTRRGTAVRIVQWTPGRRIPRRTTASTSTGESSQGRLPSGRHVRRDVVAVLAVSSAAALSKGHRRPSRCQCVIRDHKGRKSKCSICEKNRVPSAARRGLRSTGRHCYTEYQASCPADAQGWAPPLMSCVVRPKACPEIRTGPRRAFGRKAGGAGGPNPWV